MHARAISRNNVITRTMVIGNVGIVGTLEATFRLMLIWKTKEISSVPIAQLSSKVRSLICLAPVEQLLFGFPDSS